METMTKKQEKKEAIEELKKIIEKGDTVYTVLRHVSKSGMTRGIDCYVIKDNRPRWITAYVGKAIGCPQSENDWRKQRGLRIGGCGMDMGFHVVNNLGYAVYNDGYAFQHNWI